MSHQCDYSLLDIFCKRFLITGRNEVVAKVIFLHLSVILFTGGVCLSASWDATHPPGVDTPPDQTPGPDIPQSRHPPSKQTPAYGQRAAGTHPTGMHSCSMLNLLDFSQFYVTLLKFAQIFLVRHHQKSQQCSQHVTCRLLRNGQVFKQQFFSHFYD